MEFQFSIPEPPETLFPQTRYTIQLAAVAGKLATEERARVYNPDGRPENVADTLEKK